MIEVRAPQPEDRPALDALFRSAFGAAPAERFWEWKYRDLPGESRARVALLDGQLVAHAGALALPARFEGGRAPLWQLVDFMGTTAGAGLRSGLVEAGRALLADLPRPGDAPWIFGFPSERHFRLGQRAFGYRPLAQIAVWAGALPEGTATGAVEAAEWCGPWAEEIWSRVAVCGVERSAAFLNWRYYARPDRYYRFYRLRAGIAEGLAVFGYAGREAQAAELWLPGDGDWAPALQDVVVDLRALGMETWSFWPADEVQRTLLRRLGAAPSDRRVFAGCRGRPGDPSPELRAARCTYMMGDYDLV